MTNTSEDKAMLLQDGTRELTSEEINLISGGVVSPREIDGGLWVEGAARWTAVGRRVRSGGNWRGRAPRSFSS